MALADGDRVTAARRLADRMFVEGDVTANLNLDDIKAAINAIDDTFDALASTLTGAQTVQQNFIAALPEPFKTTSTAGQKGLVVAFVVMKRAGLI